MAFQDLTDSEKLELANFDCGKNEASISAEPIELDTYIGTDATTDGVNIIYDSARTLVFLETSGTGTVTVRYETQNPDAEGNTKVVSRDIASGQAIAVPPLSAAYEDNGNIAFGLATANSGTVSLIPTSYLP